MLPLQEFPLQDIIALPQMYLVQVRHFLVMSFPNVVNKLTHFAIIFAVRIWDTVGEDQSLKGEYRVISGRMYVCIIRVLPGPDVTCMPEVKI